MEELLEYVRISYEEQFNGSQALNCVTLIDGRMCIHSLAMNYLLYIAEHCYYLDEADIRYCFEWREEYNTYFMYSSYRRRALVYVMRNKNVNQKNCYFAGSMCENDKLPFNYVKIRLKDEHAIKEEYLLSKDEKDVFGWNILLLYCKITAFFRNRSDKEYADILLRSALFLFPNETWDLLEGVYKNGKKQPQNINFYSSLLTDFKEMSQANKEENFRYIVEKISRFLGISIWKIEEIYANEYKETDFETLLREQLNKCYQKSRKL